MLLPALGKFSIQLRKPFSNKTLTGLEDSSEGFILS